ncbi:hypothetical protein [Pseudarthrobacter sp. LT1]|uniref:hypothetical protein n=1 Tax=Pseudarthrobacter sp. LT1 TaxID=3111450 RepID=UPI002D780DAA|nr:hypothetical protein [Pseudarthrobacter sp. LT1]WRT15627.1 hypothetical protein VIK36_09190 [Pseudarthrobacter sp. LT1]
MDGPKESPRSSDTRTNFMAKAWTGADHKYMIEAYLSDADGLASRLEHDLRFRLDDRGFLVAAELMARQSRLRAGPFGDMKTTVVSDYEVRDATTESEVETFNRMFFALALMNCRNVGLRERRAAGAGPTGDVFHEVVSDGSGRGARGASGETAGKFVRPTTPGTGSLQNFYRRRTVARKACGHVLVGLAGTWPGRPGTIEKTYTLKTGRR